jgi:UDP-glucuronate decarboxylase
MNAPEGLFQPINIGNPGEYSIKQLAELAIELTGSKSELQYLPLPADDPTRRQPDITLARKHLSWEPKIPLREGLQTTIDWFKTIDTEQYRPPTPNF